MKEKYKNLNFIAFFEAQFFLVSFNSQYAHLCRHPPFKFTWQKQRNRETYNYA